MAFNGRTFLYDGIPSDYYGLYLYSFDSPTTEDSESGDSAEIVEDRLSRRISPIHYGCQSDKPLEFEMSFGSFSYMDKYDVDLIASWLTEQSGYKNLDILQSDMENIRYKCIIKDLRNTHINGMPVAFRCTVSCDSSYSYVYPVNKQCSVSGTASFSLTNGSNINKFIYPQIEILPAAGTQSLSIVNQSDRLREFKLLDIPQISGLKIRVDNEKQLLTTQPPTNLYETFNGTFFRLKSGVNQILVTGSCDLRFTYESLRKVGA